MPAFHCQSIELVSSVNALQSLSPSEASERLSNLIDLMVESGREVSPELSKVCLLSEDLVISYMFIVIIPCVNNCAAISWSFSGCVTKYCKSVCSFPPSFVEGWTGLVCTKLLYLLKLFLPAIGWLRQKTGKSGIVKLGSLCFDGVQ